MTRRKTALLAILAALCAAFALQTAFSRGSGERTLSLSEEPDRIEIGSLENGSFALVKAEPNPDNEADGWEIEEGGFSADPSAVRRMLNAIRSLRLLDAVSSDVQSSAFGLDEESAVTVEAFSGGESLRRIKIGKASATGAQTYAVVDGEPSVQLVSGNIRDAFSRGADSIRSRRIFSLDQAFVTRIEAQSVNGAFALERQGDPPAWRLAAPYGQGVAFLVDAEKTAEWVSSVLTLTASGFEDESMALPESPIGRVAFTIQAEGEPRVVTLELYAPDEEGEAYLAASSECAQPFTVSSYTAERYLKDPADFEAAAE